MVKLQYDLSQWDLRLEGRLKELKDEFKGELKVELQGILVQYLGKVAASSSLGQAPSKGKRVMGEHPLGFPPKELVPAFTKGI